MGHLKLVLVDSSLQTAIKDLHPSTKGTLYTHENKTIKYPQLYSKFIYKVLQAFHEKPNQITKIYLKEVYAFLDFKKIYYTL